jgi:hypothetical protein
MRYLVALSCLACTPALAGTTASVSGTAKYDIAEDKQKYGVGVSFAAYTAGLAYWTWNGYGEAGSEPWLASQHGIDFSAGPLKFGPTLEYKVEDLGGVNDEKLEIGVRSSIKLW